MNFDFDWLSNPRLVLNLIISALVYGTLGSTIAWLAAPPEHAFISKAVIAGGFGSVIPALLERLRTPPQTLDKREKLASGELIGRRSTDIPTVPLPPTPPSTNGKE